MPSGADAVGTELAQRRAAEEARAERRSASERLAHVAEMADLRRTMRNVAAHALMNPLTPMLIQMHLLKRRGDLTPEVRKSLAVLDTNLARLAAGARSIVDAAREPDEIPGPARSLVSPQADGWPRALATGTAATLHDHEKEWGKDVADIACDAREILERSMRRVARTRERAREARVLVDARNAGRASRRRR